MNDTSPKMRQKQLEIIYSKTPSERAMMGVDMIDSVKMMVTNSIRNRYPDLDEVELKIAVLKRYYQNDYSPEKLEIIAKKMREFHQESLVTTS